MERADLEQKVVAGVLEIAQQKNESITVVDQGARILTDLDFDSMDVAELVAVLQLDLDLDPFSKNVSLSSVRTVKDLCEAYWSVAPQPGSS